MNFTWYLLRDKSNLKKEAILGENSISYSALYEQVEKVSQRLQTRYQEGDRILLIAQNSIFCIVSYLAIILSKCICVNVGIKTEPETIRNIYKICRPKAIFTDHKKIFQLPFLKSCDIIDPKFLKSVREAIGNNDIALDLSSIERNTHSDQTAIINYTSGSTGKSKGVELSHHNLISNTDSILRYLQLSKSDISEVILPFSYCYGASVLHTHLKVGASIVLNNNFLFPESVIKDIQTYGCTGLSGVPSTFQILLKRTTLGKTPLSTLRYVTQAGGKLANEYLLELKKRLPKTKIFVMYGQTEATARLAYLEPDKLEEKLGSVGRAISGVTLEVVDEHGKPVDPGTVGEIVATGPNIMKGYYKDPEGTRQLLKDRKLYTGDLAKLDEEGYIYIIGRKSRFLKCGGKRVSAQDIESVVLKMPNVTNAAVVAVEDEILGEAPKLVIEGKIKLLDEKHILSFLSSRLPVYMRPKKVIVVDKMPYAESGKIDYSKVKVL